MAFSVHTFETNPDGNLGFAFHQKVGEGQELYFLAKFGAETLEPQSMAETIFGAIVDHMEASKIEDHYDRFEDALKAANQEAKKNQITGKNPPEIVVAYFDFHQLYLSQCGPSEAYLIRDHGVSQITEIADQAEDLFLNILSGQVMVDDVILLSSNRILRTLTANELADTLGKQNFRQASNQFRQELSQKSEEDLLVTIIGIGKKEETPAAGFLNKMVSTAEKAAAPLKEAMTSDETLVEKDPLGNESIPNLSNNRTAKNPNKAMQSVNAASASLKKLTQFRPQKNLVILAGAVLVLLLIGLGVKSISWESEEEVQLKEELNIAREALQQADTFIIQGERESAKEYLKKADQSVQEVFKSKSKLFRSDAQFILAAIKDKQLQVENAKQVTPSLVADLGAKSDNLSARGLLELEGSFYVFDNKSVIKTVRNVVESPAELSSSGGSVLAGASRTDQRTLVFLTDDPRLIEYREGIITPMQTQDENWKKGIDIKTYGRFVYILSPTENQIWKYERRSANYSGATAYNTGNIEIADVVSFTIDGSIYMIAASGEIKKLFRGETQDYEFRELPSIPFSGPNLKIYTSAELDYIYVLDPDNQRLLVFTKGERFATYRRQVMFQNETGDLQNVRDFYIDASGQKVTILTENKIFEFNM
ncbi:protein phosphatase 2C family protein [bacterium]|nr:protein phosphatase 2C family protein [bacterium]NCQ55164.1 protein phosphatase 2C family protein [Candidatus Parcubacteria bacterium]NCS67323.1 protein phosphatase 2C family protein [Candidatus Peregrinibacteria bacterium]NCS96578.1 protein phosphatase 2C family protein [bacterium]